MSATAAASVCTRCRRRSEEIVETLVLACCHLRAHLCANCGISLLFSTPMDWLVSWAKDTHQKHCPKRARTDEDVRSN